MSMFCFQCQEAAGNKGCSAAKGVCGKPANVASLMDVLVETLKGISVYANEAVKKGENVRETGIFICQALFATITNANFDADRIAALIKKGLEIRDAYAAKYPVADAPACAVWTGTSMADYEAQFDAACILNVEEHEDLRSLKELVVYGLKGAAAYADHATVLGYYDDSIFSFLITALNTVALSKDAGELTGLALATGECAVKAMAILDKANTSTYGNPEISVVKTGVRNNPGILISGHDLKDMKQLLEQTKGTGVDVYTHSEMLPANYYPEFKKYENLAGNYGNAWWQQEKEFESFNGPILMTTNCITPVKDSYKDRFFTTGMSGWPGAVHIEEDANGNKDFSAVIECAKKCAAPTQIEDGEIVGGFAHNQVLALADKVIEAVKSGAIKRFVVMAGCDGRHKSRSYFTEVAEELPKDAVILTAGCAKYRYNKLNLGDIGGIPRVLDAGQCNDSYSLAVIALKLKEVFELADVNDLPLSFDIAWYEQKAVAVLLALLHLGFKGLRLGPTLPAFVSPNVVKVLVENFDIKPTGEVAADVQAMMAGR